MVVVEGDSWRAGLGSSVVGSGKRPCLFSSSVGRLACAGSTCTARPGRMRSGRFRRRKSESSALLKVSPPPYPGGVPVLDRAYYALL